jgi:two-component system chemotaxis response regulator CheY
MKIRKKIFILDTEPETVQTLCGELSALNPSCRFDSDTRPDRALIKIVDWRPDLLIAGADLDAVSGYDMSRVLKMVPDCSGVHVMLMRAPDGDIGAEQAPPAGADLYVQKGERLTEAVQKGIEALLLSGQEEPPPEKKPVNTVLVVDDSRTMRRIITMILVGIGISTVVEASDGMQAIRKLTAEKVDLIFVDYSMPRMNGLVFVQEVRKMIEMASVPIVAVSAELPDEIEEMLRAGANDYLSKPFTMKNVYDIAAQFASNLSRNASSAQEPPVPEAGSPASS